MMVEIRQSGKYEAHIFLGVWTIWKTLTSPPTLRGTIEQVCVWPPDYENPKPVMLTGEIVPLPSVCVQKVKKDAPL